MVQEVKESRGDWRQGRLRRLLLLPVNHSPYFRNLTAVQNFMFVCTHFLNNSSWMKEVSLYAFIEDKSQAENSPILKTSSSDIFKGKLPVASVPKDDYSYFLEQLSAAGHR